MPWTCLSPRSESRAMTEYEDEISAYIEDLSARILDLSREESVAMSQGLHQEAHTARVKRLDLSRERDAVREVSQYWILHKSVRSAAEAMMRRRLRKKIREVKRRQRDEA
jgi:hypothetical protein